MSHDVLSPPRPLDPRGHGARRASRGPRQDRAGADAAPRRLLAPTFLISAAFLVLVLLWALVPAWFTSYDPYQSDAAAKLLPPSSTHLLGTDSLGRDSFARLVHGTRTTLLTSLLALTIAFVVSSVLGLLAGYVGGIVDDAIGRVIDVTLAVPGLLVSLMLVTGLGFGAVNIAIAVGVSSIASFTRVMRAQVLRVRQADFVTAAEFGGVRFWTILRRHVFPHAIAPVTALVALEFGAAILAISALSFLGFGAAAPEPEWGSLVASGRDYLAFAWWLTILPGTVVVLVVLAANAVARQIEKVG